MKPRWVVLLELVRCEFAPPARVAGGVFFTVILACFLLIFKRKHHSRRLFMWNTPSQSRLDKIPRLYETENISAEDKLIYLHFFIGGSDWFVAEFDGDDIFFGYVVLNGDKSNAEWGYFSFAELREVKVGMVVVEL